LLDFEQFENNKPAIVKENNNFIFIMLI
jgi:hypothetical protein